ncbi:MAG: GNAT family protein [Anaerolineae bacterium]
MSSPILTTPRLTVRPFGLDDAPAYLELSLANHEHLARFEPGNPARSVHTLADSEAVMRQYAADWEADTIYFFGAWRQEDSALLAQVALMPYNPDLPEDEVGCFVDGRYEGQGYATESLRAVVDYAFRERGAKRVSCRCSDENVRSQRLIVRCGFTLEGILRDCNPYVPRVDGSASSEYVYGILRGEWEGLQRTA